MIFKDRNEAGKLLAEKLKGYKKEKPIILAIPRGGVVIGSEIAKELNAELNVIILKKIGAPYNPELAIGSICQDGSVFLNEEYIKELNVKEEYIKEEKKKLMEEINERKRRYWQGELKLKGKIVILVDDGIATGATALIAIRFIKKQGAKKVILAVPISSINAIDVLGKEAEVVCLYKPELLMAIGQFYQNFEQVEDEEVMNILKEHRKRLK